MNPATNNINMKNVVSIQYQQNKFTIQCSTVATQHCSNQQTIKSLCSQFYPLKLIFDHQNDIFKVFFFL